MEYVHLLVPKDVVTGLGVEELESKLPLSEAEKKTQKLLIALKRLKFVFR